MKKTMKRSLLGIGAAVFAFTLGVAVVDSVRASAEPLTVTDNFYMADGAAIRIKGEGTPSGIRWKAIVTEAYYNQISASNTKTVEFGTYVDNTEIVEEATTTRIDIPCTATPNFVDGVWSFHASITYDELKEQLEEKYADDAEMETKVAAGLAAAYETELYARAYVTVNETTTLAESIDTGRSIKGVATYCLIENTKDVTADNKNLFETYAGATYTVASEQAFNNQNVYNATMGNGAFTAKVENGEYDVYVGAKYLGKATATEGEITVNAENLAIKAGEMGKVILINGQNKVTTVPFISANDIISTKAEFSSFLTTVKQQGYSGYAVLTADIDFGGEKTAGYQGGNSLSGTFNGLGYTVSNVSIHQAAGIFGDIAETGVVKNAAFVGLTADIVGQDKDGRLLANECAGTLENVYVEGRFQESGLGVVKMVGSTATIRNCIFNTTQGTPAFPTIVQGDKLGVLENVYAIGNATQFATNDSNKPYENVEAFLTAQKANITAENGWGEYWEADNYSLYFNGKIIITKAEIVIKDLMYKTSDFDLDLSALAGGTVDSLFINDVKMPVPENGVLSIKVAEYGGENTITVGSGNLLIKQPFAIVTDIISTKAEFSSFLTTVKQQGYSGYAVLTANIDFGGEKTAGHNEAVASFSGTFDGCGYTVSNIAVHQTAGIFGNITTAGVIKNVAFVGITADISGAVNDGRLLANQFMGTLENVYVEGCFQEKGLGVVKMVGSTATIRNCIFNTTQGTPAFPTIVQGDKLGVLENVYAIGNATQFATYDSNKPYENVEAFLTAQKANITAENGWNMNYWSVDTYGIVFGGNIIATVEKDIKETNYKKDNFEIAIGENVEKLYVNGVETEIVGNTFAVVAQEYTLGETNTVEVWKDGTITVYPFVIVSDIISTKAEFSSFLTTVKQTGYSGYAVLTADIDFEGAKTSDYKTGASFSGTFNGLGHTISNLKTHQSAGIFGNIATGGIIKNAAFVEIFADIAGNTSDGRLLADVLEGTLENVYVQGRFNETGLGIVKMQGESSRIRNCVFNVEQGTVASTSAIIRQQDKLGTIESSVYAISSELPKFEQNTTNTANRLYTDVAKMLAENESNFTAENGWNMNYWSIDANGNLYFGTTQVK